MYNTLETLLFFQNQTNQTHLAINVLLTQGYSQYSLKPYQNHVQYLYNVMKDLWQEFKQDVESDESRADLCNSVIWRPVTGYKYQKMIADPAFKKRWNL